MTWQFSRGTSSVEHILQNYSTCMIIKQLAGCIINHYELWISRTKEGIWKPAVLWTEMLTPLPWLWKDIGIKRLCDQKWTSHWFDKNAAQNIVTSWLMHKRFLGIKCKKRGENVFVPEFSLFWREQSEPFFESGNYQYKLLMFSIWTLKYKVRKILRVLFPLIPG